MKTNVPGAFFMGVLIGIGATVFAASRPLPEECTWQPEMDHVEKHLQPPKPRFIYED